MENAPPRPPATYPIPPVGRPPWRRTNAAVAAGPARVRRAARAAAARRCDAPGLVHHAAFAESWRRSVARAARRPTRRPATGRAVGVASDLPVGGSRDRE